MNYHRDLALARGKTWRSPVDKLLNAAGLPVLHEQDDPICAEDITFHPSWTNNDTFCQLMGLSETPTCMPCTADIDRLKESPVCKAMVSRSATVVEALDRSIQLYFDTGASHTSTPNKGDFMELDEDSTSGTLDGIASGLTIEGTGRVQYIVLDDNGKEVVIEVEAYYVPTLKYRLVSPQDMHSAVGNPIGYQSHPGYLGEERFAELEVKPMQRGYSRMKPLQTVTMQFDKRTNLPIHAAQLPMGKQVTATALQGAICETSVHNKNLNNAQKELLHWHFRLGHVGFKHIQFLARSGKLPTKNPKSLSDPLLVLPKCAACQFGKACRRPTKTSTTKHDKSKEMELKKNDLMPGDRVSVDHFQSSQPGRLYSSRGRTDSKDMFHGGSIFSDHASGYIQVRHQVSLNAEESIKAKVNYERDAANYGVFVKAYHTDNGVFTSKDFMGHLIERHQNIRFSGAGAAHQNGVAERGIKTVVDMARTMLIHAAMRSPSGTISAELWPMAIDHAVWIYNRLPRMETGLSAIELYGRSTFMPVKDVLSTCHTWGCPAYVLEPKLQKGGVKIPKWAPRSRRGAFMGFSRLHSTMVGLILNLNTRSISPQFHVVFDDMFTSVVSNQTEVVPKIWTSLLMSPSARLHVTLDTEAQVELDDEWLTPEESLKREATRRQLLEQDAQLRNRPPDTQKLVASCPLASSRGRRSCDCCF